MNLHRIDGSRNIDTIIKVLNVSGYYKCTQGLDIYTATELKVLKCFSNEY